MRRRLSREVHKKVWEDHLKRCDCHDSWDQCPCVEEGHHSYRVPWRGGSCSCCRWCSPNRTGKTSPFVGRLKGDPE